MLVLDPPSTRDRDPDRSPGFKVLMLLLLLLGLVFLLQLDETGAASHCECTDAWLTASSERVEGVLLSSDMVLWYVFCRPYEYCELEAEPARNLSMRALLAMLPSPEINREILSTQAS